MGEWLLRRFSCQVVETHGENLYHAELLQLPRPCWKAFISQWFVPTNQMAHASCPRPGRTKNMEPTEKISRQDGGEGGRNSVTQIHKEHRDRETEEETERKQNH